jgi:hypothetical protein
LNEEPLGAIAGDSMIAEFEITSRLLPRNLLRIEVELPQNEYARGQLPPAPFGEVRLEIRS